jgi:hypothetical protein
MAGYRITQQTILQIDKKISGGYEVLFELAAEGEIQAGENACGVVSVRSLTGESDFWHRGDQGSRDAVSRDVGDVEVART